MLDRKEIDIEIARLEYGESSYAAYAKLATLYAIRNQMDSQEQTPDVPAPLTRAIPSTPAPVTYSDSEFLQAASEKDLSAVLSILDDLMDTLQITAPKVYNNVLRKIKDL